MSTSSGSQIKQQAREIRASEGWGNRKHPMFEVLNKKFSDLCAKAADSGLLEKGQSIWDLPD